jgi:hypothetical protein
MARGASNGSVQFVKQVSTQAGGLPVVPHHRIIKFPLGGARKTTFTISGA